MNVAGLKTFTRRPPFIFAILALIAVLAFAGVHRLVNRFHEQQKALARHLYERGTQAQSAGESERALADFRAALGYARDNFDYQLSLARALRDTGRTAESETYLISLWERTPQDGAVNLALGRLFAREGLFDKTIQYYHYATYGFWPGDSGARQRDTQLELIEYLLRSKAYPQAQAELIPMAAALPRDSGLRSRVAGMFARAQDNEHALEQFRDVLRTDHDKTDALFGAGQAAFQLGRYRTAQEYLESTVRADPQNVMAVQLLSATSMVLQGNPYAPHLSDAERNQRLRSAFRAAGERLDDCAQNKGIDLTPISPASGLPALKAQWVDASPKVARLRVHDDATLDEIMNLVFEIERQTQALCGPPDGLDQALLLISQERRGVEQ
jgi:tetratricopeptide (TPR) repeat protein